MSPKVVVIGLDGGTFKIIQRLMDQGRLPILAQLAGSGIKTVLRSTMPPSSAVAWPSLITGVNPGKHGIFDFFNVVPQTYSMRLVNSRSIAMPRIWQLLNRHGIKTGIVNVPITYPPEALDGFMISGILIPSEHENFTYPSSLHTELLARLGPIKLERGFLKKFRHGDKLEALNDLYVMTRAQTETLKYLISQKEWDFLLAVYRGTDLIQHVLGKYWNPVLRKKHPKEYLKFKAVIPQFYEELDRQLGELFQILPPDCTIMVLSDHGAGYLKGQIAINQWLMDQGYLKLKSFAPVRQALHSFKLRSIHSWAIKAGLSNFCSLIPNWLSSSRIPQFTYPDPDRIIDWSRTLAYASWHGGHTAGIRLNLRGREPNGIVEAGASAAQVLSELTRKLRAVKLPNDSQGLFEEVIPGQALYNGALSGLGPDLVATPRGFEFGISGRFPVKRWFKMTSELNAQHRMDGILFAAGSGIRAIGDIPSPCILDIPPTLLKILGVPVPDYMDGRVIQEMLTMYDDDGRPSDNDNRIIPISAQITDQAYSQEEEKLLEDHLRSLGYIE